MYVRMYVCVHVVSMYACFNDIYSSIEFYGVLVVFAVALIIVIIIISVLALSTYRTYTHQSVCCPHCYYVFTVAVLLPGIISLRFIAGITLPFTAAATSAAAATTTTTGAAATTTTIMVLLLLCYDDDYYDDDNGYYPCCCCCCRYC